MTVIISNILPAAFLLSTIWILLALQHGKLLISQDAHYFSFFVWTLAILILYLILGAVGIWGSEAPKTFSWKKLYRKLCLVTWRVLVLFGLANDKVNFISPKFVKNGFNLQQLLLPSQILLRIAFCPRKRNKPI
jgi:hypothetical protein